MPHSKGGNRPTIPAPEGFYGCTICRQVKPVADFHKRTRGPGGHSNRCKECACRIKREKEAAGQEHDLTAPTRFWNKVRVGEGCWEWTHGTGTHGYGHFLYKGKMQPAHRAVLLMAGVEVPEGMFIDHTCRNRLCVKPAHLRVVTPAVNTLENNSNPWALNARKTECPHGHPYLPGSYYSREGKGRQCKECARMHSLTNQMARKLGLPPRGSEFK